MEIMLRHNENLKVVEEEHEQLKIAFAEQSQRYMYSEVRQTKEFRLGGDKNVGFKACGAHNA